MGHYVAFLTEIDLDDAGRAGGKASILGHLSSRGFSVPNGFCVLASAYEDVLSLPGIRDRIQDRMNGIAFSNPTSVEEGAAAIADIFSATTLPNDMGNEILGACKELVSGAASGPLLAVRSSAATRDLTITSFPGQMESYLNIRDPEKVLERIRGCWASAFSYSSIVNRRARDISHFDVFVAPIVQLMVEPASAGVMFTENPLDGQRDQVVINACFGLGEGVVSGGLRCDHFVVHRDSDRVLQENIGDKDFKIVLDERRGAGNTKIPLGADERGRPSLSRREITQLVKLARDIEDIMGSPQDIEWAFEDGKLYILQSRAIAPAGASPSIEAGTTEWTSEFDSTVDPDWPDYTLSNISEVLPEVLTPLSISDIGFLDYAFMKCNSDLGLTKGIHSQGEYTFIGIFYGRAHLNLSVYRAVITKIPGATTKEFDRRAPEDLREDEVAGWRPTPQSILALPGILARTIYQAGQAPKRAVSISDDFNRKIKRFRQMDYEKMPYPEIFRILAEIREDLHDVMAVHIAASQFSVSYYDLLSRATARLLGDSDGILAARLVTGLQYLESAMPSVPIWDLSRMVEQSGPLWKLFTDNEPGAILKLLAADPSQEAEAFLRALDSFLDRFGYRGVNEAEAMSPNWEEDPSYVLAMIKNYLQAEEGLNPRNLASRQAKEREEAVNEALGRLKGLKRLILLYLMK